MTIKPFHIKAVLFDFDGTLTLPGALDFNAIKATLNCPPGVPILEFIESLPDDGARGRAMMELDRFEKIGSENSRLRPGVVALVRNLKDRRLKLGIISRNSHGAVSRALENFPGLSESDFDLVLTRDDPVAPKPSPEGIFLVAKKMGVPSREMMVVGDYIFDVQAGRAAGALTVYLDNAPGRPMPEADFTVTDLMAVESLVRLGLPLRPGKLPSDILDDFLANFAISDASVLIRPGVGEDTAAVSIDGAEVLVLTSDPITFATDAIGLYAVGVNANDLATSGAEPRWLQATLLFPGGVTPSEIGRTMHDLEQACGQWGITICGGHTEITDAVSRPVVVGTMAGTVAKKHLIDKRSMKTGDQVLLTKRISVEGTAILAREFADRLQSMGMPRSEVEICQNFLSQISVLPEARAATAVGGISAMHDITEGGLATAVRELCVAGKHGIRVDVSAIPIYPETDKICRMLELDPLGLIGSGSMLICCRHAVCSEVVSRIRQAGVEVARIGEVTEKNEGIDAFMPDRKVPWPAFEVDEITRMF